MHRSWRLAGLAAVLSATPLFAQRGVRHAAPAPAPTSGRAIGIGAHGGIGYAGWGFGNRGFAPNLSRFGFGGGFGLGAPMGTWSPAPSIFAPRPLVPSAAPAWIDRSQPAGDHAYGTPIMMQRPEDALAPTAPVAHAATVALPLAESSAGAVTVKVALPHPDAQVWFGEAAMPGAGAERVFRSPPLALGQTYLYVLKATWTEHGQLQERVRSVTVRAGDNLTVDFAAGEAPAAPAPANLPAAKAAPPLPQPVEASPPAPALAPVLKEPAAPALPAEATMVPAQDEPVVAPVKAVPAEAPAKPKTDELVVIPAG